MKTVGIFGGTFDPMHRGHLSVAMNAIASGSVDEVWMMISPENPFKHGFLITPAPLRVEMARLLVGSMKAGASVKVSDFELSLPTPTYAITTLRALRRANPDCRFRQIVGADNVADFDKWRESDAILRDFGLIVYPRPGYNVRPGDGRCPPGSVILSEVPEVDAGATEIRSLFADMAADPGHAGADIKRLAEVLSESQIDFILANRLYEGASGNGDKKNL